MDSKQSLFYALGQLAYSVAMADGAVQQQEKEKFMRIMSEEAVADIDFDYADIIFKILEKDHMPVQTSYEWALHELKLNSHHLTPTLKEKFADILDKVAEAFPPVSNEEKELLSGFREDVRSLS